MSVNNLLRNKHRFDKFLTYWKTIAENNLYLQHTPTSMHFIRHDIMRIGTTKIAALKSPYMGLEQPSAALINNASNNTQWVWSSAIVIASEVQEGNEAAEQVAMTNALVIIQSILSKLKSDRMNNRLLFFDFENVKIHPVREHFRNCVGYRMTFNLPSQFDLNFNADEWQNEPNTAEPSPFATVYDQSQTITLQFGDDYTCETPFPGTANVYNTLGTLLATATIPSDSAVPIELADVEHTDSDGTPVTLPINVPFAAALCPIPTAIPIEYDYIGGSNIYYIGYGLPSYTGIEAISIKRVTITPSTGAVVEEYATNTWNNHLTATYL